MDTRTVQNTTAEKSTIPIDWKVIVRFALVAAAIPLLLFVAAGRVDWWQGWVYAILTILISIVSRYVVFLKNPDLIAERARFTQSEGIKSWDKWIVVFIAVAGPLIFMITAG